MKTKIKRLLIAVVVTLGLVPVSQVYAAGSMGVSTGSINLTTGGSASFTVSGNNAAGRVNISTSNGGVASISRTSVFVDNSSESITVNAVSAGSATITIRAADMTTYDDEVITGATRTITVNVSAPAAPANSQPATSNTTSKTKNNNTKKNENQSNNSEPEPEPEENPEENTEEEPAEEEKVEEELTEEKAPVVEDLNNNDNANMWRTIAILEAAIIVIGGGLIFCIWYRKRKHPQPYANDIWRRNRKHPNAYINDIKRL